MLDSHKSQAQLETDLESEIRNIPITQQKFISTTEILRDYSLAAQSRQASLIARREVLSGKAKFGIFGDGKEVAQIAMAKAFRKGDFRSGYYRDQTFMLAIGRHEHPALFRPTVRPRRRDPGAEFGRPPDERPFCHADVGRKRPFSQPHHHLQLLRRHLPHRLANAPPGGVWVTPAASTES
jgi:hypothetical protein